MPIHNNLIAACLLASLSACSSESILVEISYKSNTPHPQRGNTCEISAKAKNNTKHTLTSLRVNDFSFFDIPPGMDRRAFTPVRWSDDPSCSEARSEDIEIRCSLDDGVSVLDGAWEKCRELVRVSRSR